MKRPEWTRSAAWVDGAWLPVADHLDVEDPATGRVVGTCADSPADTVDTAVVAARAAFLAWSATPPAVRADHLRRLLERLTVQRDLLVETTVTEVGAPVTVAREGHVDLALAVLASDVDLLREGPGDERVGHSLVQRVPLGVAACITPWNYPLYQLVIKVAAALAAGCTVVAKPAELAPLSAHLLVDAACDLPPGVVNLVPGRGATTGRALAEHPGVDVVSFTGSTAVGVGIAQSAARHLTRVSLELGGKSASLVVASVRDLGPAVRATVDSATYNSGQTCSAWTRLVVPEKRYEEAVELAVARAAELVVGDPRDPATDLGPLVSAAQRDRVEGFLSRAAADGARVHRRPGPLPSPGWYCAPAVVADVDPTSEIAREEVFGPVLVVLPARDDDHAVEIANGTAYGLAGAVWADTDDEALALAGRLRAGQVDVNGAAFNPCAPFGGFGLSGLGRELGRHGLDEFTEVRSVQLPVAGHVV